MVTLGLVNIMWALARLGYTYNNPDNPNNPNNPDNPDSPDSPASSDSPIYIYVYISI